MCAMGLEQTDFHRLVMSLSPAVYMPLGIGSILRRDGSAVRPTINGTPSWGGGLQSGPGHGVTFRTNDSLLIAAVDCALTNVSSFTLFVAGKFIPGTVSGAAFSTPLSKREAGGVAWVLNVRLSAGVDYITILDTTAVNRQLAFNVAGSRTLGARCQNGQPAAFFSNGTTIGVSTANTTLDASSRPLYIGNRYDGTIPFMGSLSCAIHFPSLLTDEQVYDLDRLWSRMKGITQQTHRSMQVPIDLSPSLPAEFIVTGRKNIANALVDRTGNGLNAPVGGINAVTKLPTGDALDLHGTGGGIAVVPSAAGWQGLAGMTLVLRVRPRTAGQGNAGRFVSAEGGGVTFWDLLFSAAGGQFDWQVDYADGVAVWRPATTMPFLGDMHTLVVAHQKVSPFNTPVIELDGEALVVNNPTPRAGALVADAGAVLNIGNVTVLNAAFDGLIESVSLYDSVLTAAQRRAAYVKHAVRSLQLVDRYSRPETLGASGLRAGPWLVGSGGFSWLDDLSKRRLVCVQNGWCSIPSTFAYGAWYWRARKGADANALIVLPVASVRGAQAAATQNGYDVVIDTDESIKVRRITGGAVAATPIASAAGYVAINTEYEFFLNRRLSDGQFNLWIRGGAYAVWTLVGTGADTTYTASVWMIADLDDADELSSVLWFPEGYTLLSTDVFPG